MLCQLNTPEQSFRRRFEYRKMLRFYQVNKDILCISSYGFYFKEEKYKEAFTRTGNKNKIFAVFNFSNEKVEFTLEGDSMIGNYRNFFTGKVETFGSEESFRLEPWRYKLFVR